MDEEIRNYLLETANLNNQTTEESPLVVPLAAELADGTKIPIGTAKIVGNEVIASIDSNTDEGLLKIIRGGPIVSSGITQTLNVFDQDLPRKEIIKEIDERRMRRRIF